MKTKLNHGSFRLFLEKRLVFQQPPESPEKQTETAKTSKEIFKQIEEAVKALEQGKGEHEKLVNDLCNLLRNPESYKLFSPELLASLANRKEIDIKIEVAQTQNTSTATLEKLAIDTNAKVRSMVAAKFYCPRSILKNLASDPDQEVRSWVAQNENTPSDTLVKLANDPDQGVSDKAGWHLYWLKMPR